MKNYRENRRKIIGSYRLDVISLPEECDFENDIPLELVYIFRHYPEHKERVKQILNEGKAIGVRTLLQTPENILKAIHTISVHSQLNYIITWLPNLLRDKHLPVIDERDRARALSHGENIDLAVEVILADRLRFKHLVLIDEENKGIKTEEQHFMNELSEIIYPLQVDYAIHRVVADNANERTKIAQAIIKMLLIIGPIAHILEKYAAGIGKIFAASTDDVLGEAAELSALRGSGFSWRELSRRSLVLIPVLGLASYGAYSVEHLLTSGRIVTGGVVFGLSAVALSITTAIQSFFMYYKNIQKLKKENKLRMEIRSIGLIRLALRQDFTNPARLGLLLGAAMAPFFGIIGSFLHLMSNGWILALIGSSESIFAGITVMTSRYVDAYRFKKKLRHLAHQKNG